MQQQIETILSEIGWENLKERALELNSDINEIHSEVCDLYDKGNEELLKDLLKCTLKVNADAYALWKLMEGQIK